MISTGKIIAAERIKNGLSREALAERLGIATETLARYERGNRTPKLDTIAKLCEVFGVSPDYFTAPSEDNKKAPTETKPGEGNKTRRIISMEDWIKVPIVSREWTACCGAGIAAEDITSWSDGIILFPRTELRQLDDMRRPFAVRCEGDCMESAGIFDGDLAIINPAEEPQQGAIALVSIGSSLSLKRYYSMPNGDVVLQSDHGKTRLTPEQMERDEFFVSGVLAGTHRGRPKTLPL